MRDRLLAAAAAIGAIAYLYADWRMPVVALGDPLGPRAFPALIGVLLFISACLLAIESRRRAPEAAPATPKGRSHLPILLGVVVWTACYYAAFEPAGYVVATIVYLLGLLYYFHRGHYFINILISGGFTAVAYVLFSYFLNVQLPPGPLGV